MKAASTLLKRWEDTLVFRIGEDDCGQLEQIPCPLAFPDRLPTKSLSAPYALGQVFAVALLKLTRPWPPAAGAAVELDACGGWLGDFLCLNYLVSKGGEDGLSGRLHRYSEGFWACFFGTLGTVLEIALLAPDRLPELNARIDALDNATLHALAVRAVLGDADDFDFFAGLYR